MRYPSPNKPQTLRIQIKKEIQPVWMRQKFGFTKLKNLLQILLYKYSQSSLMSSQIKKKKKLCWDKKSPGPRIHHNLHLYAQPNVGDTYKRRAPCVL